jgi:hypothetical protein
MVKIGGGGATTAAEEEEEEEEKTGKKFLQDFGGKPVVKVDLEDREGARRTTLRLILNL